MAMDGFRCSSEFEASCVFTLNSAKASVRVHVETTGIDALDITVLVVGGPDYHKVTGGIHGHGGPTLIVVKRVVDLEFAADSGA